MNRLSILLPLVFFQSFSLADTSTDLQKAEKLYGDGDCAKAVPIYEQIRSKPSTTIADQDLATFRIAYCHYVAGEVDSGIDEFERFLKRQPNSDEALLRYAESLLSKERYEDAIEAASKVKDAKFLPEAKIAKARAYLELQETDQALEELKIQLGNNPVMDPVFEYWRGLAYLQTFNFNAAERSFKTSLKYSTDNHWTKSAASSWLESLEDTKSLLHPRVGLSYGYDTNIGSIAYKESATASPTNAYDMKDFYLTYDASLALRPIHFGKSSLTPSVSTYGLKYAKTDYKSYNVNTYSADLAGLIPLTHRWNLNASGNYTSLSYDSNNYLDYLSGTLGTIYAFAKTFSASLSYKNTKAIGIYPGQTGTVTFGLSGETPYFYWLVSYANANAIGDKASYSQSAGVWSVAKGSSFSNYVSNTFTLGIGRVLPLSFDLFVQASQSNTEYSDEGVPPINAAFSTKARKDVTTVYQANLSKSLIQRRLAATLSFSMTNSKSDGYQGLLYSTGVSPDYNYDRTQTSLYLTYGF